MGQFDAESQFEAVKIAMTQDKNGHVLRLSIHPNDTPEAIMRDPVGTRYIVGVYRLGETDEPVPSPETEAGMKAVKVAGVLCSTPEFQDWLVFRDMSDAPTEEAAAMALRRYLGIASRAELKGNRNAQVMLSGLAAEFRAAMTPK